LPTDLYSQVHINDGEGLFQGDLQDMQKFARASLNDQLLASLAGASKRLINPTSLLFDPEMGAQNGVDLVDPRWAYCLQPGQAFLQKGSANHKIAIAPGVLLQKIAATSGSDATFLPYTFTGAEEWTLTNGDATNPRVDLLQLKLEYVFADPQSRDFEDATSRIVTTTSMNKKRRVQATLSVKAGTPAASPQIPEPDSGFVPVGSVMVGNGWTTAGNAPIFGEDTAATNNAVVHDQRMPLRVRAYRVDPSQFKLVTAWASSNNGSTVTSSNATNLLYVPCPAGLGRLVGVSVQFPTGQAPTPATTAMDAGRSSAIVSTSYATRTAVNLGNSFLNDPLAPLHFIESIHTPSAGPTISQSATSFYGVPLWTNGRRCPFERHRLANVVGSTTCDTLVLRLQSGVNSHVMGAVTFFVAEGI
jgi:hypothetical protein